MKGSPMLQNWSLATKCSLVLYLGHLFLRGSSHCIPSDVSPLKGPWEREHSQCIVYDTIQGVMGELSPKLSKNQNNTISLLEVPVVIVVGNEHGDTSSNLGWDWLHFT